MSCESAGEEEGCTTVAEMADTEASESVATLFNRYGVDIYNAGHSHEYVASSPVFSLSLSRFGGKLPHIC